MQRLGFPAGLFSSFLTEHDLKLSRLRHEINRKFEEGKYKEVEILLNKTEKINEGDRVYKIFTSYIKALLFREKNGDPHEVLSKLEKIVSMSVKNFSPGRMSRLVLSELDIRVLENTAVAHYNVGNKEYAQDILSALKEYIEKRNVDFECVVSDYIEILYLLSTWALSDGNDEAALHLCEKGSACCVEYNSYRHFSKLLLNKSNAFIKLGKTEEALESLKESFYLERALGNNPNIKTIGEYAEAIGLNSETV